MQEHEVRNPFAPTKTPAQWAQEIRTLIGSAEADGHDVWFDNSCCGCSSGSSLNVSSEGRIAEAFSDEEDES